MAKKNKNSDDHQQLSLLATENDGNPNFFKPKFLTNQWVNMFTFSLSVLLNLILFSYDVINMPPVSLIQNVQMQGQYYQFENTKNLKIPIRMEYRFNS